VTDLVKRLCLPVAPEHHDPFKSGQWARIHTQVLDAISAERKEAADEIKRLQKFMEEPAKWKHQVEKALLDDIREWANPEKAKTEDAHIILSDFLTTLDAYEKERLND